MGIKQATKRIYFDNFRNLPPPPSSLLAPNTMGSEVLAAVFCSPDYARLVEEDHYFRVSEILSYWVGAAFAGGGSGSMWADARFQFGLLNDEDQMMLMLRDNFDFEDDKVYDKAFDSGCGFENKHRLLPKYRVRQAPASSPDAP